MIALSKTRFSLVVFLLVSALTLCAQKPWHLHWGKFHKPENPGSVHGVVHADQFGYYALRVQVPKRALSNKAHQVSLELYDTDLNFIKSGALDMKYQDQSLAYVGFTSLQNKHFLLSCFYNKKQDRQVLVARPVNLQTLKNEGQFEEILEMKVDHRLWHGSYTKHLSPDSSLLLVCVKSLAQEPKKKEHFSMSVMDSEGKVLWSKEEELPYLQKDIDVKDYAVDNHGNAYVLISRNSVKNEKKAYSIFAYRNKGASVREYESTLENKYITNLMFNTLDNGDLLCAGFYADVEEKKNGVVSDFKTWNNSYKDEGKVKGVFSYKLNGKDAQEYDKNFQALGIDILASDLSSRKQEKIRNKNDDSDQKLRHYELNHMLIQKDGSTLLVGEKFTFSIITDKYSTTNIPHHDDLLVVTLSPQGEISWACKVDKKQKGPYNEEYLFAPTDGNHYFIYENGTGKSDDYKLVEVSATGKVAYHDFKEEGKEIEGTMMLASASKTMIVWSGSESKCRLGKIVFD